MESNETYCLYGSCADGRCLIFDSTLYFCSGVGSVFSPPSQVKNPSRNRAVPMSDVTRILFAIEQGDANAVEIWIDATSVLVSEACSARHRRSRILPAIELSL